MSLLIIQTGKKGIAYAGERCAKCGRRFEIGEPIMGVQIHYDYKMDYQWGSIHYPECPIKTKTWYKNSPAAQSLGMPAPNAIRRS